MYLKIARARLTVLEGQVTEDRDHRGNDFLVVHLFAVVLRAECAVRVKIVLHCGLQSVEQHVDTSTVHEICSGTT